jgi:hypothetical protein
VQILNSSAEFIALMLKDIKKSETSSTAVTYFMGQSEKLLEIDRKNLKQDRKNISWYNMNVL